MGFWHTGYLDQHEPTGLDWKFVPQPVFYTCASCDQQWKSSEELLKHRFESHPALRPLLIVREQEMGATPHRVTRGVTPSDFAAHNATYARIDDEVVPIAELGVELARHGYGRVKIELGNDAAHAFFEINFSIASVEDCIGVERSLESMMKRKRLDPRAVDDLIEAAKQYKTAGTYLDGLTCYLYGVLSKERYPAAFLTFEGYRERFQLASATLSDFDRPLARSIRAIVSYNLNHFSEVLRWADSGPMRAAAERLSNLLLVRSTPPAKPVRLAGGTFPEDALTDIETTRTIRWALADSSAMRNDLAEIDDWLREGNSVYDQLKVKIVLAEYLAQHGDISRATAIAKAMRNNATTGGWAEALISRTSPGRKL